MQPVEEVTTRIIYLGGLPAIGVSLLMIIKKDNYIIDGELQRTADTLVLDY